MQPRRPTVRPFRWHRPQEHVDEGEVGESQRLGQRFVRREARGGRGLSGATPLGGRIF